MKTVRLTGFGNKNDGLWEIQGEPVEKPDLETGLKSTTLSLKRSQWKDWTFGNAAITELLVIVNGHSVIMQTMTAALLGEIRARAMWTAGYGEEVPTRWQIFAPEGIEIESRRSVREVMLAFGQTIYINPRPGVGS